jgi:hypothetical protein
MPRRNNFPHLPRLFSSLLAATTMALCSSVALAQTCPLEGDATQALARQLNPYKNRSDAPPASKINSNATLGAVLAPGPDLDRWSRDDAAIFEGVVINVKPGGIESVNCHASDPAHRDTHIEMALSPAAPSRQRVIVEVTPRWRTKMQVIADWSTSALKKALIGKHVRVIGWLFDDLEHRAQAENSNPGGTHNWRATVWEIHPVTGFTVLSSPMAETVTVAPVVSPHAPKHHRATLNKKCTTSRRSRSGAHVCRRRASAHHAINHN